MRGNPEETPHPGQADVPDPLAAAILMQVGVRRPAVHPDEAHQHLTGALHHPEWPVRLGAVQTLAERGEAAPLETLVEALRDEHPAVRAAAARTLGTLSARAAVVPLAQALQDPIWRVRAAAALALGKLRQDAPLEPLVGALHDADDAVRAAAVWALGELGAHAPVEPLAAALHDSAWSVREAATLALRAAGQRAPIALLRGAQQDADSSVRAAAGLALQSLMFGQAVPSPAQPPVNWAVAHRWRVALALFSLLMLIPLSLVLFANGSLADYTVLVGRLLALGIACLTIVVVNFIANQKPKGGSQ